MLSIAPFTTWGVTPAREVVERHIDPSVEVYGRYAAVRLPLTNGVRVWNPTAIRVGPRGEIFVANYVGEIYRLLDSNQDGLEDTAVLVCNVTEAGLKYPTTMAFKGNDLYVGTAQRIQVYEGVGGGDGAAKRSRPFQTLPWGDFVAYWTFGLCVGPDGAFYVNLATDSYIPTPIPDPDGWRGSLLRISPDGRQVERFATGLRFCPGMAFDSKGNLFFSDNEGGGNPTEELNLATVGTFYGHNPGKFSAAAPGAAPLVLLTSGRGTCGIAFNPPGNDFGGTSGDLFVAFWGTQQVARDGSIARVKLWQDPDGTFHAREIPFCNWLFKAFDLAFGPSGDLYVTQFGISPAEMTPSLTATGAIYRLIYAPWVTPARTHPLMFPPIRGNSEHGRRLFVERACATCHAMDGTTELLGPNLLRLGERLDYAAAVQAVLKPSENIRSGYEAESFETAEGELLHGRIVSSDTDHVTLMMASNPTVTIQRTAIRHHQSSKVSLMPEGLLEGLDGVAIRDLFAYLEIQERPYRLRWRYRLVALAALAGAVPLMSWFLAKAIRAGCPTDSK